MNVKDSEIKQLLEQYKKITVYGLSTDATKPSQHVPAFMRSNGYELVGIYPRGDEIAGFKIYQKLQDVPADYRKFLDVFRRPEHIPDVVKEVLEVGGVEVLWLQLGITHPEAEKLAEDSGIKVVSNRCMLVEYKKYFRERPYLHGRNEKK